MYACDLKKTKQKQGLKRLFLLLQVLLLLPPLLCRIPVYTRCMLFLYDASRVVCVCKYCPLGYLCARLQSLTPTFRAVEVFIRDKYERKKYYNKEASATAQVSINNTVCVLQFVSVCYCCGSMQRCHSWRRFHVTSV